MNDDPMDEQLRELFAVEELRPDAEGPAADALLDSITSQAPTTVVEATDRSVADPVVDGVFAGSQTKVPNSRSWMLVAAVAALVALLGLGVWQATIDNAGPVLSDDGTDVAETPVPQDEGGDVLDLFVPAIRGVDEPLAVVVSGDDLFRSEVANCVEMAEAFRQGWGGAVVRAYPFAPADGFSTLVATDDGADATHCSSLGSGGGGGGGDLYPLEEGEQFRLVGTGGFTGGVVDEIEIKGLVSEAVTNIRIVDSNVIDQVYRTNSGWFVVAATSQSSSDGYFLSLTVEISFSDGTSVTGNVDDLAYVGPSDCDADCLRLAIEELAADATNAGFERQAEVLVDGELTQQEYDNAVAAFESCVMAVSTREDVDEIIVLEGSIDANAFLGCDNAELEFVERARLWTNESTLTSGAPEAETPDEEQMDDESLLDEAVEDPNAVLGDAPWIAAAEGLFFNGLDESELMANWSGYPYPDAERDDRITAYLQDFSWVQSEPLVLELNEYQAFPGTEFFTPIVTVTSQDDPTKAVVFVMGWQDEVLSLQRIPEFDRPLPAVLYEETSITIEGVGTEGTPAAFLGGEQLEIVTDLETLTTTINSPAGFAAGAVVTVVFPTPEIAGADVHVIE